MSEAATTTASIGLPANSNEAKLAGRPINEQTIAHRWRELGCKKVVVKAGADRCFLSVADRLMTKPVNGVAMVDASGAGDAFNTGYLAPCLRGRDCESGIANGQRLAAWVIQRSGAVPLVDEDVPYAAMAER